MILEHHCNDLHLLNEEFEHLLSLFDEPEGHYLVEVAPKGLVDTELGGGTS